MQNENKQTNKGIIYSSILLCFSLIIFSVFIPSFQYRINSLIEKRHIYDKNVMNAQNEINKADFYVELCNALDILKEAINPSEEKMIKALDEIRENSYEKIPNAVAKEIFLLTEPVDSGKPNQQRLKNLADKPLEELRNMRDEAAVHMTKYAGGFSQNVALLEIVRFWLYLLASMAQIIGVWLGITANRRQPQSKGAVK